VLIDHIVLESFHLSVHSTEVGSWKY